LLVKLGGELEVYRVFTGFEKLVIVNAALTPVDCLLTEDVAPFVERLVFRSPKDAARVRFSRSLIMIEHSIVISQCRTVVIPMAGHCEGIGDEGTEVSVMQAHDGAG
jgi:hypothetical protein